jgi:chromosome segregation ATPase
MLKYGVRVLNERRKLWRAAELLTDIWNQDQHSRSLAAAAIEKYNGHMAECNRVVEAQLSGRPSAVALEAGDAKHVVESLRAELSAMESLKKEAEAQVKGKEKYIGELSARVAALEKTWDENGGSPPSSGDTVTKLVARVNLLQQQLEAERKRNLQLKGA